MAARRKKEEEKLSRRIPVQVTESFQEQLNAMAEDTGKPIAEHARELLAARLAEWRKNEARAELAF